MKNRRTCRMVSPIRRTSTGLRAYSSSLRSTSWVYTKVIAKLTSSPDLKLQVMIEAPAGDEAETKLAELKSSLRDLGLDENIDRTTTQTAFSRAATMSSLAWIALEHGRDRPHLGRGHVAEDVAVPMHRWAR